MKCLSLMQPYAELVVTGRKTIELRSWNTKFRGRFIVHASKKTDIEACRNLGIDPSSLANGAAIGTACIYGVKEYKDRRGFLSDSDRHLADYGKYRKSRYGFMLEKARKFRKPIRLKGMLNFFDFDYGKRNK
ncbi:MAG: ASCH domain-containing protein [Candidatus Micrarchaeota archaeon]|nr:ASCH domain-containing protein [Candidatus Micrarchaeota archaeon]